MNFQIHFHCLLLCICNDHAMWNLKVFNVNMNIIVAVLLRNFSFVRKNTHRPFFSPPTNHMAESVTVLPAASPFWENLFALLPDLTIL